MGFVNNQCVISTKKTISLNLCQQYAVGHQLDQAVGGTLIGEAHLIAYRFTHLDLELFGDAGGDGPCSDSSRLGMANKASDSAPGLQANFRYLGGFAGPGFTGDHDHLVLAEQLGNFIGSSADRQFGVGEVGNCLTAAVGQCLGF